MSTVMREKRKRTISSQPKGLSAGEKLNRNRLLAECDLRWNWIGTEAKHISEITYDHCLRASGLALLGSKRPCPNKFIERDLNRSIPPQTRAGSEDPEDIIVISDEEATTPCDRRRCRDNPYCLNYLGQDKWEDEEQAEEAYLKLHLKHKDPRLDCRGWKPVGLKNLGATCYANAFLQVWFQDLAFRSGVYRCQPSPNNEKKFRDSPIFQLQVTFTALQEGKQSVFNPVKLVESLRLRTSEQQDAQEFSKLFMSHLDDEFKKQSDPELQSLLSNQFEGKMVNATVCDNCKTRSERETTFLELEVNLEKKNGALEDRIASILTPERLDENNKYFCSVCGSLQNATRYTEIRSLPPVLHISLLRFVYDLTTYERKKSKIPLKFPPYLNMKPFLQSADPDQMVLDEDDAISEVYELRGVLLHKGPSAYHGHYEAQVYNQETKKWYQFNDEVVTPLSSFYAPKPAPNTNGEAIVVDEDEPSGGRPAKRQKKVANSRRVEDTDEEETVPITKATKLLSSKDAYMLVYARREDPKLVNTRPLVPPSDAFDIIRSSNEEHDKACHEYEMLRDNCKGEFTDLRDRMREIYLSWHVVAPEEHNVIVSKSVLEQWLLRPISERSTKNDDRAKEDDTITSAEKGKPADTDDNTAFAHVDNNADDQRLFIDELPPSTRKTIDSTYLLCPHAVNSQEPRFSPTRDKDMKVISSVARDKIIQSGFTFTPEFTVENVCKRCIEEEFLEKLYQMEHPRLVAEFNEICGTTSENEGFWISKAWLKDWQLNKPRMHIPSQPDPSPENISDDPALNFRSHIYCKHDNLNISIATRRRISFEAVELLRQIFRDWHPPPWDAEACPSCDVDVHISKESKLEQRKKAETEKALFYRLNNDDVFGQQGVLLDNECAIIPSDFVHRWRRWLSKPGDAVRPSVIDTQSMLCDHGRLLLDLSDESDLDNDVAVLLIPEWERLRDIYNAGPLIQINCSTEIDEFDYERKRVVSEVPCCRECRLNRRLNFSSALLTVIRVDKGQIPTNSSAEELSDRHGLRQNFTVFNGRNGASCSAVNGGLGKPNGTRQSRRLLEGKNSARRVIEVQKQWTVKDIKVAVNKAFKVPTISQRLYYNGVELDDNAKSVAELQILNKQTIYLKVDAEDAIVLDSDVEDDAVKVSKKREEGDAFKGTLLSGGANSLLDELSECPTSPIPSLEKQCSVCTLLNPPDAEQCAACEAFL